MYKRIGILGDIGAGKSLVAKQFGFPVFNADQVVNEIYKKNKLCYKKLKKKLHKHIKSYPINKIELSKAIISNKKNLKTIVNVVHPIVRKEMNLFIDWFIEHHHGYRLSKSETENWLDCLNILTQNAISQPQVLVHRDYHSRNLMFLDSNNPGILDFQDAVIGPITYDLVSLLRDCYISLNLDVVADFSLYFYKNLDEEDKAGISHHQFTKFFDLMGIQRHLKAVGIFTRLNYRDGKSVYLNDIPRTLKYILTVAENYPEIIFLVKLIKKVKCRG